MMPQSRASMFSPAVGQWSPPQRSTRIAVAGSTLHIIGVPLLILASIGVGFVTVILKEVLLPFVISLFLVYLIRPLVNLLTTPFGRMFVCCAGPPPVHGAAGAGRHRGRYARLQKNEDVEDGLELPRRANSEGNVDVTAASAAGRGGGQAGGVAGNTAGGAEGRATGGVSSGAAGRKSRSPSKYPKHSKGIMGRILATATGSWSGGGSTSGAHGTAGAAASAGAGRASSNGSYSGMAASSAPATPRGDHAPHGGRGKTGGGNGAGGVYLDGLHHHSSSSGHHHQQNECGCCWGPLRFTRCPRWFAILVSMAVASALLAGLVIMVADAIQRFQQESLGIFVGEAGVLVDRIQRWLSGFGIALEGQAILDAIKQQITVTFLVETTVTVLVDGVGNAILVLLLVLYLLSEAQSHAPGSLRARIDDQIQRYLGIKTLISAGQGGLVYLILGPWGLQVRMAHVFGVIHFLLNFIPTAGPILATVIPLPVVLLDPSLSGWSKALAFIGPSVVHFFIGNFLEPLVFGSSMELHPVVVLLSLALWYALWGVPGAILAVPITAVLRIVLGAVSNHPYAAIVISILEGRLSAAMEGVDTALDVSAVNLLPSGTSATGGAGSAGGLGQGQGPEGLGSSGVNGTGLACGDGPYKGLHGAGTGLDNSGHYSTGPYEGGRYGNGAGVGRYGARQAGPNSYGPGGAAGGYGSSDYYDEDDDEDGQGGAAHILATIDSGPLSGPGPGQGQTGGGAGAGDMGQGGYSNSSREGYGQGHRGISPIPVVGSGAGAGLAGGQASAGSGLGFVTGGQGLSSSAGGLVQRGVSRSPPTHVASLGGGFGSSTGAGLGSVNLGSNAALNSSGSLASGSFALGNANTSGYISSTSAASGGAGGPLASSGHGSVAGGGGSNAGGFSVTGSGVAAAGIGAGGSQGLQPVAPPAVARR